MPTSTTPLASHLAPIDLALVALYLIAITLFGLRFSRKNKTGSANSSLKSYFLADNTIPWWAIALSIVSAETSTLTIVSIPGVAFAGNMGFLQVVLGYMTGRIVVALLFLPRYFRGEMLTAYQLIDRRFGHALHKLTAGLFLLTRAAAEGVRVFAISIVVSVAIGTGDTLSIALISLLTLLYTFEGGMAAVIWTDVVQMGLYLAGTLIALVTLGAHVPGGWAHIHAVAAPLGKFHWLDFSFTLTRSYTFWAGLLGGTFLTMASHGTDQLMVQRMLAARNLRESRLALLSSGVVIFFQFTLFLLIGIGLFVFYGTHPQVFRTNDHIFPTFIVQQMPHGIAGLLVAAILAAAMSNLSAALNSLASTTVIDFYIPFKQRRSPSSESPITPRQQTFVSRASTVFWGVILFAIAIYCVHTGGKGHVVETGLSIASVAYGCLLGVFLLGTLTRYATQAGAILGMIAGLLTNLTLWQFPTGNVVFHPGSPGAVTVAMPHIAFTWYVLIGSAVTFAVGTLFSLALPRKRTFATALLLLLMFLPSLARAQTSVILSKASRGSMRGAQSKDPEASSPAPNVQTTSPQAPTYNFTEVDTLITTAIAAHKVPGAVVLIGHNGHIAYEHAYGNRKLAGEPGLDGKPSPAEPMTTDTIFDMASLTKVLVTTTAILQLYEQGKLALDTPVGHYLPDFAQNGKDKITIRQLLTHYSGLPEDISLKDPWGLTAPDKAEGIRRAMAAIPYGPPGQTFKYSDINFITLGALVEKLSGETLDRYAMQHIFAPLGMRRTRYLPEGLDCSGVDAQNISSPSPLYAERPCKLGAWHFEEWIPDTAPTAHDDQGTPAANPNYDHLLRGTVHDPTTRRMGGVAGHAGVFSTAEDASHFCDALLAKLLHNTGPFPLKQSTLQLATSPQAPATAVTTATIFTPDGQTTTGVAQRGLGWDINSPFSRPRGTLFPIATGGYGHPGHPGSFGHTGFTGTSLWLDPTTDTYVILLANSVHIKSAASISTLRGQVATAAARALHLDQIADLKVHYINFIGTVVVGPPTNPVILSDAQSAQPKDPESQFPATTVQSFQPQGLTSELPAYDPAHPCASPVICDTFGAPPHTTSAQLRRASLQLPQQFTQAVDPNRGTHIDPPELHATRDSSNAPQTHNQPQTLTGIDVLESTNFAQLTAIPHPANQPLRLGLLANQASLDAHGQRTIDLLAHASPAIHLQTIFTPEHGLRATQDTEHLQLEQDPATHIPVISLYGPKPSDKHPRQADLKPLDAIVIDLQDAGVRFWTYEAVLGYMLEACSQANIPVVVLDRPNPLGGGAPQGPVSQVGLESYTNFMPLPVRHSLTFGELARFFNARATQTQIKPDLLNTNPITLGDPTPDPRQAPPATLPGLHAALTVILMQGWQRSVYFADTGLAWTPPSPNLRTLAATLLYPGVGLVEQTNISVGRGTDTPFENLGASFLDPEALAAYLTQRHIPGITITPTTLTIAETPERYPSHGQRIPGIHFQVTDRDHFDSPEFGIELLAALHHLYPKDFQLDRAKTLLASPATLDALKHNDDPRDIAATWRTAIASFERTAYPYRLY